MKIESMSELPSFLRSVQVNQLLRVFFSNTVEALPAFITLIEQGHLSVGEGVLERLAGYRDAGEWPDSIKRKVDVTWYATMTPDLFPPQLGQAIASIQAIAPLRTAVLNALTLGRHCRIAIHAPALALLASGVARQESGSEVAAGRITYVVIPEKQQARFPIGAFLEAGEL
ncbi:hypothetical protein KKG41_03470 [Patescibacteria group bacterium]|nr:hypothetical protein [Patescibacteria group bacterium]MBU1890227.1 hypothetical protein [Patescibacteria group bacterium]